jgi:small subunit ribosomal protein S16
MAAKIRLKRVGRKGQPSYRVVVLDGQKPRDAKVVADLGSYDPKTNPPTFEIDSETALKWLLDGAKATSAARNVLAKAGVMEAWDAAKRGETIAIQPKELKPSTKRKKKEEEPPAEEAQAEEPVEEPAVEESEAEEPAEEPAEETSEATEEEKPAAEEEAEAEKPADEAEQEETEEAAEPVVEAEDAPEEEPEAEEPADDEEEAKEEA